MRPRPGPTSAAADDLAIVERDVPIAPMVLGRLVALAGDHHDVAGARRGQGHGAIAARRSGSTIELVRRRSMDRSNPCLTASMMAAVSSRRGLSEVTTTTIGAARRPPRPSAGRLPASRSPPQPNTTTTRPVAAGPAPGPARQQLVEAVGGVGVVDDHGEGLARRRPARSARARRAAGRGPAAISASARRPSAGGGVGRGQRRWPR